MKWPKRKEAVMKGTFSKTSTTHKARTNKLKDCYRDFVLHFSSSMVGGFFFFCLAITKNSRNLSSIPALPAKLASDVG